MKQTTKVVLIDWVDSTTLDRWQTKGDMNKDAAECRTVGFLIERGKFNVVVCASESGDQGNQKMIIPNGCIKRIKTIATIPAHVDGIS